MKCIVLGCRVLGYWPRNLVRFQDSEVVQIFDLEGVGVSRTFRGL